MDYYYFFARVWFSDNCRRIHDFWGQPHTPHVMKKMADSGRQTSMSAKKSSSWILFICGDLEKVLAIQVNNVEVSYSIRSQLCICRTHPSSALA